MKRRVLVPMMSLVAACAGGGGAAPPASPSNAGAAGGTDDAPLRVPPWSASDTAEGGIVYAHAEAGVRFPARVQGIDRQKIVVYSPDGPDAGFYYQGALQMNGSGCAATITAFVYPAKNDADSHFRGVVSAINASSPAAQMTRPLVDLSPAYGGPIHQATLSDQINGVTVDEMVSLSRRGRWFVKLRTTTQPAGAAACRLGLLAFVAGVQQPRAPAVSAAP